MINDFYPRPPRGGRRGCGLDHQLVQQFLSTPSARRATTVPKDDFKAIQISIHALREEGDRCPVVAIRCSIDFYPRPPRGGRRGFLAGSWQRFSISIHALREEGDPFRSASFRRSAYFYPRPPRGGRHCWAKIVLNHVEISIHALREEGDVVVQQRAVALKAFLSTPSARRATPTHVDEWDDGRFLSTPSARRATQYFSPFWYAPADFYPRPPRGGRQDCHETVCHPENFYPRPPRGGRPWPRRAASLCTSSPISIHALREEGDEITTHCAEVRQDISIHALREEGDP